MKAKSTTKSGIEIMIVEDSAIQVELLRRTLVRNGYQVTIANNGAEALALMDKRKPTLVISDIAMPVMDGYRMCHEIKHNDSLKDIPVILCTQLSDPEDIFRGLNAGADNYVPKPYNEKELLNKIEYTLTNLELRKHEQVQMGLKIHYAEKTHTITSDRLQLLDLLMTSFSSAVEKNRALAKRTEELLASEERYRALLENTFSGFYSSTPDGKFIEVNPAYVELLGYENKKELMSVDVPSTVYTSPAYYKAFLEKLRAEEGLKNHVAHLRKKNGSEVIVEENVRIVKDPEGNMLFFEGFVNDITERLRVEEIIRDRAFHDSLTNLPNRVLFTDRLTHALVRAQRNQQMLAVMFLNVDGFKHINDTMGHDVGDQLLKGVAERLTASVRESDTVARLGGDEFTVLLPEIAGLGNMDTIAWRITESISQPWEFNGQKFNITASIGIALFPKDGKEAKTLMNNADTAMYYAKAHGKNNYKLYTPSMSIELDES